MIRRNCTKISIAILLATVVNAFAGNFMMLAASNTHKADVIVYGDAAVGVSAAVQAARMGKSVILVSQYGHLGGLTSSGLGWTDIGNSSILGGISREFYHRVYLHYQDPAAWSSVEAMERFPKRGQGAPTFDGATQLASVFEPKVAEKIFEELVAESGVQVIEGRLNLSDGADREGARIKAIRLEDGTVLEGSMFIDASYEGDLLEEAGVSFQVGREANEEYGETGNGITGALPTNQLPDGIDPYVVPGNPKSGLLAGVNPTLGGEVGDADHRLQAFCYRMVLTDDPDSRTIIDKPKTYQEADYEILFRAIEAGQDSGFFKTSPMPNAKTDSNNASGISTDYIGMNYSELAPDHPDYWDWTTLSHEEREAVAAKHRDWQLGLVWTLQNHDRIPEGIRTELARWGLPKDEFPDNGHWPYNLYVREGRRMISDVVMTERHCRGREVVHDSIGKGAYTMDSHNTQRFVSNGMVKNEGDIQVSLGGEPYAISYRAIIPRKGECENLLVPWCLSSTHIAFGSIRMEPVGMILGQSAATAASLAIDEGVSVQDVDYDKMKEQLIADGQRL
ncbi:FAD-dependent oxidoreductase [Pelagicoccus sp. SDUM812002]|uniref:FAD-dependent oxidoreductase n=1 Tax=Pelagicoccus sp. SDUM812002 TaxID=3041266 RepID=UPI00280DD47E|nr:FAD-dependent oxidoreductase [Pelagicoccus sp. SDUM812002]MDQ8188392.1 FAD-dependent oxidoreductase [Pelagicoccus sp. SDUM812002]